MLENCQMIFKILYKHYCFVFHVKCVFQCSYDKVSNLIQGSFGHCSSSSAGCLSLFLVVTRVVQAANAP